MSDDIGAPLLIIHEAGTPPDALIDALRGAGFTVEHAVTGEALDIALRRPYRVVVIDARSTDASVERTCRVLRESGRALPLVVVADATGPQDHVRALDAGADDFLQKPFDIAELCARIRAVTRRRHR